MHCYLDLNEKKCSIISNELTQKHSHHPVVPQPLSELHLMYISSFRCCDCRCYYYCGGQCHTCHTNVDASFQTCHSFLLRQNLFCLFAVMMMIMLKRPLTMTIMGCHYRHCTRESLIEIGPASRRKSLREPQVFNL